MESGALVGGIVNSKTTKQGEELMVELEVAKRGLGDISFVLSDPPMRSVLVDENDNPIPLDQGRYNNTSHQGQKQQI